MYFETHAHYDDKRYKTDRDSLIDLLKENSVTHVINVGVDMKSSAVGVQYTKKYDLFYCSVGIHPHNADEMKDNDIETLKKYTLDKKVIAIGEIGLDFFYDHSDRDSQRRCFKKQLELANDVSLPVIIHSRDACQETLDILKNANINKKGVIHCFSGSVEIAKEYIKMGYYIGVGGVVTFPKSTTLVNVVREIPIERILLETDCPYLSPVPHRGERNDSRNLKYISEKVAEIKNISVEEVCSITTKTAMDFFAIL